MKSFDTDGQFWTDGRPERKVAGRLRYSDADGVVLDLIGSLHNPMAVLDEQSGPDKSLPLDDLFNLHAEPVRILGETPEGSVTLENCLRTNGDFPLAKTIEHYRETYKATVASIGGSLPSSTEATFAECRVIIDNLADWVRRSLINSGGGQQLTSGAEYTTTYTIRHRETFQTPTAFGSMELFRGSGFRVEGFKETVFTQNCQLRLLYDPAQTRSQVVSMCTKIQDLVTIGLSAPASIESIAVSLSGSDESINLYGQLASSKVEIDKRRPRFGGNLFDFNDIGGINGLASWIDVTGKYHAVVSHLVSHWYQEPLYVETRFNTLVIAAESMLRIRHGEHKVDLRKGLNELANEVGQPFLDLVGDVDAWAQKVVVARINNVVHRGLREHDRPPLYVLSQSLYFLTVLCLLRECGVKSATFDRIQHSQPYLLLSDQLKSI